MGMSLQTPAVGEARSTASSSRIRVLIADETHMGCQLMKNALSRFRFRFEIVASAISCSEIVECMKPRPVDVALLSESLHGGTFTGFQALNELQTSFPHVRVIMLLKSAPRDLVVDAFRARAEGVVCRTEPIGVLCKCIQTVHKGQIWVNSDQLHFIVEAFMSSASLRVISAKGRYLLSHRDDEVANLVVEGMTNREIAQTLGVTEQTVSNLLFRIYEKLGVSSRVELVLYVPCGLGSEVQNRLTAPEILGSCKTLSCANNPATNSDPSRYELRRAHRKIGWR